MDWTQTPDTEVEGPFEAAAVLIDPDEGVIDSFHPKCNTSSKDVAQYWALNYVIILSTMYEYYNFTAVTDSDTLVKRVKGELPVANTEVRGLHDFLMDEWRHISSPSIEYKPRSQDGWSEEVEQLWE